MMDSERKPVPRWNSTEIAKLKDIILRLENGKMKGPRNEFWQEVADEMKACGYDRQAGAVYVKWHRIVKNAPSKQSKRTPRTMWDVSDSDDLENENEGDDEEDDEGGARGDGLPLKDSKDDDSTPWTEGNNWSEEEDAIAFECIKGQRERETKLKLEPITADEMWRMVSKCLASRGFYRKCPNVCRYWNTKGKEKHNLDARTPSAIEKAQGETVWVSEEQAKQKAWKPYGVKSTSRQDKPSSSILESSTENSSQQTNFTAETNLKVAQPLDLSPQQHAILMAQYLKYNHLDNPVMNKLQEETGLSREQIRVFYRNQKATDKKETELHTQIELPAAQEVSIPHLGKPELGAAGSKRYRTSDIGFQRHVEEEPTKRVRHSLEPEELVKSHRVVPVDLKAREESSDYHPAVSVLSVSSNNNLAVSTIEVQHLSLKPKTQQVDTQDHTSQLTVRLTEERRIQQQKILAAQEHHNQLELAITTHRERAAEEHRLLQVAIDAHKKRANAELEAAKAKELELQEQKKIMENAEKKISCVDELLNPPT
ncbi:039eb817-8121-40f7-8010-a6fc7924830d [Sclerotinia trifoliorum]|uniref:039eb817-8121-40f7-8010-a6fc7924830d n=1 Tax=Sclerotinia trifoliorum TaxID=28548 RepID=A0A8H2ZQR5_9HELO|nr:039eb817-8121-40f7-8010-a6fc7924830d [Sclerotinia trifoliorum]